ncbi:MAG: TMEM43 family protein [Patescibacteria group bacterium]
MADTYTTTTRTSYGQRIMNSIKGVLFGIVMFLASFGVLYWNEGRADMSDVAKKAVVIEASNVAANTGADGTLVSATGTVTADTLIGDDLFLKPGPFYSVSRNVEVFAWVETSTSTTKNNTGGSSTTETTYSYKKEWTNSPADSSKFHVPEGHTNVMADISDASKTVPTAMLEQYNFSPQAAKAPAPTQLSLQAANLSLTSNASLVDGTTFIFVRNSTTGTYSAPELGDVRVSYSTLAVPFEGTLFGKLNGSSIDAYVTPKGDTLYRAFLGGHDQAVAKLHSEYTASLWGLRLVGFLMMWMGLSALFGPISIILDFLPIFGTISRSVIGMVTFAVAFVLSCVTIVISAILHSLIAVIVVCVLLLAAAIGGGVMWKKKQGAKKPAATPAT